MEAPERAEKIPWRQAAAMAAVVAGILLVGVSIIWPRVFSGRSGWSDEKASGYQAAASRLHELSMKSAAATPGSQTKTARDELAQAEADYARIRGELDTARERPQTIAKYIRYSGALLLLGGTAALLIKR